MSFLPLVGEPGLPGAPATTARKPALFVSDQDAVPNGALPGDAVLNPATGVLREVDSAGTALKPAAGAPLAGVEGPEGDPGPWQTHSHTGTIDWDATTYEQLWAQSEYADVPDPAVVLDVRFGSKPSITAFIPATAARACVVINQGDIPVESPWLGYVERMWVTPPPKGGPVTVVPALNPAAGVDLQIAAVVWDARGNGPAVSASVPHTVLSSGQYSALDAQFTPGKVGAADAV